jgi:hypothetical protein
MPFAAVLHGTRLFIGIAGNLRKAFPVRREVSILEIINNPLGNSVGQFYMIFLRAEFRLLFPVG